MLSIVRYIDANTCYIDALSIQHTQYTYYIDTNIAFLVLMTLLGAKSVIPGQTC